jgi:HAD domain in Swiss Army Knife RNA repair proteins
VSIIFLDIDGVLNSSRSVTVKMGPTLETSALVRELGELDASDGCGLDYAVSFGLRTADPVCVALLNKLLDDDIGLVLSSSHRGLLWHSKVPFGSTEHLRRLRLYLTAMGVEVPHFFSVTPMLHKRRGDEIAQWVEQALEDGTMLPDEPWVILDDSADMLDDQPLVLVSAEHGFSHSNYLEACLHLRLPKPPSILL